MKHFCNRCFLVWKLLERQQLKLPKVAADGRYQDFRDALPEA
jgi:hypothetical protein